jgi:hypothetical protein
MLTVSSNPQSFRALTERLARASAWLEKTRWPTRPHDVATANRLYFEWIAATDRQRLSSGERDRYPLVTALDEAFLLTHDEETAEHLCVVFAMAFEARAYHSGANHRRDDQ